MDHFALRLIDAHERVLDLQSSIVKALDPNKYAAEVEDSVSRVYLPYRTIMQQGDFLARIARSAARGDEYRDVGRYNSPKYILDALDSIEGRYRNAMSTSDPREKSFDLIYVLDTITDSIHGSLMITTQIASVQPIHGNVTKDARFLSILASHYIGSSKITMAFHLRNARKAFYRYKSTGKIWG